MSEEEEEEERKEVVKKEDVKEEKERKEDVKEAKKEKKTQDEQTKVILLTPVKGMVVNIMCRIGKGWERLRLSRLTRNNALSTRGRSRRR